MCNPLSLGKLDERIALLDVPAGARVVDIATGTAGLLVRPAERPGAHGVGVDLSPYSMRDAREKAEGRGVGSQLELLGGWGRLRPRSGPV